MDGEEEANNYGLCYDTLLVLRKDRNSVIDQTDFALTASYLYKNKQYCEALSRLSSEERKQFILSHIESKRSSQQRNPIWKRAVNLEEELRTLNNNIPI